MCSEVHQHGSVHYAKQNISVCRFDLIDGPFFLCLFSRANCKYHFLPPSYRRLKMEKNVHSYRCLVFILPSDHSVKSPSVPPPRPPAHLPPHHNACHVLPRHHISSSPLTSVQHSSLRLAECLHNEWQLRHWSRPTHPHVEAHFYSFRKVTVGAEPANLLYFNSSAHKISQNSAQRKKEKDIRKDCWFSSLKENATASLLDCVGLCFVWCLFQRRLHTFLTVAWVPILKVIWRSG